jgi:anti-anti-sigma factor
MNKFKHFIAEQRGDLTRIRLANPAYFDTTQYGELQNELAEFVEQQQPGKLLVDLSVVEYCSTAVMSALLAARRHLESTGGQMKVCGMNDTVREAFQRLKLASKGLEIYATEAEAIEAF